MEFWVTVPDTATAPAMVPPPSPWKLMNSNVPVKMPVASSPEMVYRASPPCPSGMTSLAVNGARGDGLSAAAGGRTAVTAAFETVRTRARAAGLAAGCRTAAPPAGANGITALDPRSPPWKAASAISSALLSVITAAVVTPLYGEETPGPELPPPPPHEENDTANRTDRTETITAPRLIRIPPIPSPADNPGRRWDFPDSHRRMRPDSSARRPRDFPVAAGRMGHPHFRIAPVLALVAMEAYFPRDPVGISFGGIFHCLRRSVSTTPQTSSSSVRAGISSRIRSPLW